MVQEYSRAVDHLVLPVSDLDVARARLNALGFQVAPNGRHPFGTVNACVFLPGKIYLEPLAIADLREADAAIADGNVFVQRDRVFRQHRSEGLSAIVLQSDDVQADQAAFMASGVSGGDMLEFSRPVRSPDGQEAVSSFRLAFAVEPSEDQFFLFSCQRLNPLPVDRTVLEAHANGTLGLKNVLMKTGRESDASLLVKAFGTAAQDITNGHAFQMQNLSVEVSVSNDTKIGLLVIGLVFAVADLEVTAAVLTANGVSHTKTSDGIVVPAAPGQGVAFLFEENAS